MNDVSKPPGRKVVLPLSSAPDICQSISNAVRFLHLMFRSHTYRRFGAGLPSRANPSSRS